MPASTPTVRGAIPEDHDSIEALAAKLGDDRVSDGAKFSRSFAEVLADAPRTIVHVAEVDGVVVGYALTTINTLLYTHGASAQLQEIVVDDSVQTSGVGTALVSAVESACEQHGVTQLTVASRRAGGFYDRLGYTQQAEYMRRLF